MNLRKQTYNACRELLISKVYPHLKVDPNEVGNKIHNNEFYNTIYGGKTPNQLQKEFDLQDKYLKQSNESDLKHELSVMNLAFVTELEKHETNMEKNFKLLESEELLHKINLEFIAGAGLIARGKSKKEALEIFRRHLGDLSSDYKEQINKEFKKLGL